MREDELVEALRLQMDRGSPRISLGRVMVREIIQTMIHQQSRIRYLQEQMKKMGQEDEEG